MVSQETPVGGFPPARHASFKHVQVERHSLCFLHTGCVSESSRSYRQC